MSIRRPASDLKSSKAFVLAQKFHVNVGVTLKMSSALLAEYYLTNPVSIADQLESL
jgi:hypothetical protein